MLKQRRKLVYEVEVMGTLRDSGHCYFEVLDSKRGEN